MKGNSAFALVPFVRSPVSLQGEQVISQPMRHCRYFLTVLLSGCLAFLGVAAVAQAPTPTQPSEQTTHRAVHSHRPAVRNKPAGLPAAECAACIQHNLEYLAGPSLHGRGSGTEDEHHAAQFIASRLRQYGLAPAAEDDEYIQTATMQSRSVTAPPVLSFNAGDADSPRVVAWRQGKEIAVPLLAQPDSSGPLQKLDATDAGTAPTAVREGAVLLLKIKLGGSAAEAQAAIAPYMHSKAAMVVVNEAGGLIAKMPKLPRLPTRMGNDEPPGFVTVVLAKAEAFNQLWAMPEGTIVKLHAAVSPWRTSHTWNVLAKREGAGEPSQIVLLSAHLDHLGVRGGATYPGADDDASGTVAVMELARAIAKEPAPKRTVVVALWGSEELGMLGARYFLQNPTFELKNIVANLEFEMIARPDPKLKPDSLWLTGLWTAPTWARSWRPTEQSWLPIHIPSRTSSPAPTTMRWPGRASWRKPFPASDCTRTTISPPIRWTRWTGSIWTWRSDR